MVTYHHSDSGSSFATLALTIDDEAARRVVRRDRDSHAVTEDDADAMAAHLAGELGEDLVAVVELDAKVAAFRDQHDLAIEMNQLFLGHSGALSSTNRAPGKALWARR